MWLHYELRQQLVTATRNIYTHQIINVHVVYLSFFRMHPYVYMPSRLCVFLRYVGAYVVDMYAV